MKNEFNLEGYLSNGVENIIKNAMKATLTNPEESLFLAKYAVAGRKARSLRQGAEAKGEHIPPFLISSITSSCNLHCQGCYARANHACHDAAAADQLKGTEWGTIFQQAKELGIGFVLLAGGEPLLRMDVMKEAAGIQEIIFPIFTNGTIIGEDYLKLFRKNRNLLPVISIEGNQTGTDRRRGEGIYQKLMDTMEKLHESGIFYGVSVTVTTENLSEVFSETFLDGLYQKECKLVFYVEYVPVDHRTRELAPGDAEPCPFSPYSDTSLKEVPLREALHSPLFLRLQSEGALLEEHAGGCVLFEKEELVRQYAQ